MRSLAMMLLWLVHGYSHAQQGSLAACIDQLAVEPRFVSLVGKLDVGAVTNTRPGMLADTSMANEKQRSVISDWAAARAECIKVEGRYGNAIYRPPLQAFGIAAENRVMAAAVSLYNRKISFGEFNRERELIAEELRRQAVDLSRQIQIQRSAQEQADRQTRERETMQREVEEAERQAMMAKQDAEQERRSAAEHSTRVDRRNDLGRYQSVRFAPYRNCYRFGNRMTCTAW